MAVPSRDEGTDSLCCDVISSVISVHVVMKAVFGMVPPLAPPALPAWTHLDGAFAFPGVCMATPRMSSQFGFMDGVSSNSSTFASERVKKAVKLHGFALPDPRETPGLSSKQTELRPGQRPIRGDFFSDLLRCGCSEKGFTRQTE